MKRPSLLLSFTPFVILIAIISFGVRMFGDEITAGPSQIALLFSAIVSSLIAMYYLKVPWEKIEEGMMDNLSKTGSAIFILLMIGALTGSWMMSGIVPTMIYYGLKLIHPSVFLLTIFILTGCVSLMVGSSWTTIGTVGVAMLTAGQIMGYSTPLLAGAIISGAYFGDKISPLSDTTNLAASIAGVELYKHVKYMLYTTVPAIIITAVIFGIIGIFSEVSASSNIDLHIGALNSTFLISPWLLLVPAATIYMIVKKMPPVVTLFLSALAGAVVACIFQPEVCSQINQNQSGWFSGSLYSSLKMLSGEVSLNTGDALLDSLTSTSGMAGMLDTVWLILCVVVFGGVMQASGMIQVITEKLVSMIRSTVSLVSATVGACIFVNLTLSDQYMGILIPGKMFSETYNKKGLRPELLSRTLEDGSTVTSVLIPWNTCGIVQSSVLNVATLAYLPYCFFNLMTPIITIIVAAIGYKIEKKN
ncbi:MAG: Na+/H+ antiporter NhaC [Bacteroidales bacterium]